MPFKSEKQRRYMWKYHPDIAQRWSDKYGSKPVKGGKTSGRKKGKAKAKRKSGKR